MQDRAKSSSCSRGTFMVDRLQISLVCFKSNGDYQLIARLCEIHEFHEIVVPKKKSLALAIKAQFKPRARYSRARPMTLRKWAGILRQVTEKITELLYSCLLCSKRISRLDDCTFGSKDEANPSLGRLLH